MRLLALILMLSSAPVAAQETEEPGEPLANGIENFLRDLFSDVEPALRELRDRLGRLDDYHPPEMLPNGDIILRRKDPAEPGPDVPEAPEEPEIEAEPSEPIDI